MKRYVTRAARFFDSDYSLDAEDYLSRKVFEADPTPYQTGLLDQFGEPLWAVIESDPIGFVRFP